MDDKTRKYLAILMGIIIIVADLFWTAISFSNPVWVTLGVIILVASIIWIYLDL